MTLDVLYATNTFIDGIRKTRRWEVHSQAIAETRPCTIKKQHCLALIRYRALQKTLKKNLDHQKMYSDAIKKMSDEGEIEEVIENDKEAKNDERHINYLPHHAVIKSERVTTKCRPVFDGSAKNS